MAVVNLKDVAEIVSNVWDCVLQLDIEPVNESAPWEEQERLFGTVAISGQWNGDVVVQASPDVALSAASRMFAMPKDEVASDEIQDALAEITNIVGGNIKSLVPGPSKLGLPSVSKAAENRPNAGKMIINLKCASQNKLLEVHVWENVG